MNCGRVSIHWDACKTPCANRSGQSPTFPIRPWGPPSPAGWRIGRDGYRSWRVGNVGGVPGRTVYTGLVSQQPARHPCCWRGGIIRHPINPVVVPHERKSGKPDESVPIRSHVVGNGNRRNAPDILRDDLAPVGMGAGVPVLREANDPMLLCSTRRLGRNLLCLAGLLHIGSIPRRSKLVRRSRANHTERQPSPHPVQPG
jgi:hypothetical protein